MGKAKPSSVLIGFGDARFSSSSRGHAPGPVRALRACMARYGHLVETPEFRMSRTCSCLVPGGGGALAPCHHRLHDALLRPRANPPAGHQTSTLGASSGAASGQQRIEVRGVQVCCPACLCLLPCAHARGPCRCS